MISLVHAAAAIPTGVVAAQRLRLYPITETRPKTIALIAGTIYLATGIAPLGETVNTITETAIGVSNASLLVAMIALVVALEGVATHAICAYTGNSRPRTYMAAASMVYGSLIAGCYIANDERDVDRGILAQYNILNWTFAAWIIVMSAVVIAVTLQSRPITIPERIVTVGMLAGGCIATVAAAYRAVILDAFENLPLDRTTFSAQATLVALLCFAASGAASLMHRQREIRRTERLTR